METWQIAMYAVGALMLLVYLKRRSDRLHSGE
jgi:hypothetical protein